MTQKFGSKVRMVGTSMGLLIPREVAKEENIKVGEDVEVVIIKRRNFDEALAEIVKMTKGRLGPFERERKDRF